MGENIRVACRVRPLNSSEILKSNASILTFPGDGKTQISLNGKTFNFDHVIQPTASQLEVYETIAKPIVDDVLNGYNGTIFAYGQTSSGKTFTMEGVLPEPVLQGIIPRIIRDIFDHIYQMDVNLEFHIKVSYFEIYLDKIRDLLDVSKTNLSVHEDKDRVPYVKGATERFVSSPEEVFDVIDEGKANRHVAVTNMNEHSSRSHSIFMITLRQLNVETQKKLHGKLYLVDLAGSEKVAKTGAEGTVLDEAKNINKSLSALGNVINALVENSQHIPYRDSKLTRILQESLGGNARTTMVICCSPAEYNEGETKSTLLFGMRAKTIKNCVTVNEELNAEEWRRRYEREKDKVQRMRSIIAALETEIGRWRNGEKVDKLEWISKDQYNNLELMDPDIVTSSSNNTTRSITKLFQSSLQQGNEMNDGQINSLYAMLDDKDDEINKMGQVIAQIREQMEEQDSIMQSLREERDNLSVDNIKIIKENEVAKEESKELLQALEELATSYELKQVECDKRSKETEEAFEALQSYQNDVLEKNTEIHTLKDTLQQLRKKHSQMLSSLTTDISDLAEIINAQVFQNEFTLSGEASNSTLHFEDEYTRIRLHLTKMKSEVRVANNRLKDLEDMSNQYLIQVRKAEEESRLMRIKLQENDIKLQHLNEKIEENENRKRVFQEQIDQISSELVLYRTNEQLLASAKHDEIVTDQRDVQEKLENEWKCQDILYKNQVKELRELIADYEAKLEENQEKIANLTLQNNSLSEDRNNIQVNFDNIFRKLQKTEQTEERQQQARKDLQTLEETVHTELDKLNNLKKQFMKHLFERMSRSKNSAINRRNLVISEAEPSNMPLEEEEESNEIFFGGSKVQAAKIAYLESNFAKLNKVHKQLLENRNDMRNELLRMEKRHKYTVERVSMLENALKEAKEGALRDRKRYNHEIEKIREAMRRPNIRRSVNVPQIVKGIRAGHGPPINANSSNSCVVAFSPESQQNSIVSSSKP